MLASSRTNPPLRPAALAGALLLLPLLGSIALAPSRAAAQEIEPSDLTQPGEQPALPFYVGLGLGGGFSLGGNAHHFKLVEEFGYHFLGTIEGPFAALRIGEGIGDGFFILQIGIRGGWDLVVFSEGDLILAISPNLLLGYAHTFITASAIGSTDAAAFNLEVAFDLKLFLAEGAFALFFRPVSFDIAIADASGAAYDLIVGGYFNF